MGNPALGVIDDVGTRGENHSQRISPFRRHSRFGSRLPLAAPRWQGCLLCSSGCHRFANFQSYRFIVAALSDLQLIAAKPPVGPALPGLGGVDLFLPSLSPEALAERRSITSF
jgi:hypothetical protein